jgi:hypothetical protein
MMLKTNENPQIDRAKVCTAIEALSGHRRLNVEDDEDCHPVRSAPKCAFAVVNYITNAINRVMTG